MRAIYFRFSSLLTLFQFNHRMKQLLIYILLISFIGTAISQPSKLGSKTELRQREAKLAIFADDMINAKHWYLRFVADSIFTRGLVQALKVKNSFAYSFDSIKTVSKLYAPDSSFRIFTWQMMKDYTYYRQRGAIQIHTKDGSLKLFPLFDASSFTNAPNDSIRDASNWIGAIYYKILLNKDGNKNVYTLLGFDENGPRSNKKWMDILTFDEEGIPHFGGNYFKFELPAKDTVKNRKPVLRYSIEYKKEARLKFSYDKEMDMLVYDHLISEENEPENLYTYVPDGSYEAFKWTNNKWEHTSKLPSQVLNNGEAPIDNAILDDDGNVNQQKLDEMIKKNKKLQMEEAKEENKPVKPSAGKKRQQLQSPPQNQNEY